MGKKEKFSLVSDFAWYMSILLTLSVMPGAKHGKEVSDQVIEVCLRVEEVRPYATECMLSMLFDEHLILSHARITACEVLKAAAWVVGEYSEIVAKIFQDNGMTGTGGSEFWIESVGGKEIRSLWKGQPIHVMVVDALLHPRSTNLPAHAQVVNVQAAMKIFIRACRDCPEAQIADIIGIVRTRLPIYLQVTLLLLSAIRFSNAISCIS